MAQAFIDDSSDDRVFVLAGYVAPYDNWAKLSDEWAEELRRDPKLIEFKMRQMAGRPDRCERFYRIIESYVSIGISVSIVKSEIDSALNELTWPFALENRNVLRSPYWLTFQAIIDALARHQTKLKVVEPVDFVFDEQSEKKQIEGSWEDYKSTALPETLRWMGRAPVWQSSVDTPGVQVADMRAWWVRKWVQTEGSEFGRFSWSSSRDIPGFHLEMTRETLRADFLRLNTKVWNLFAAKHLHLNDYCGGWWSNPGGVALHLPYLGGVSENQELKAPRSDLTGVRRR